MTDSAKFWTCQNCNEEIENQFEVCWKCQHDRFGQVPVSFSALEAEDRRQYAALNEQWSQKHCLQCQTALSYAGKKDFHEGTRWGVLGDVGELFVSHTTLHMYACPSCHRVEFFLSEPT